MAEKELVTQEQFAAAVFEDGGNLMVDMTGIEEAKFELIPRGTYLAEIDELQFGLSQSSGAHMLTFTFRIAEGELEGRKLRMYASFSQKAIPYTKAALARIDPVFAEKPFSPKALAEQGQPVQLVGRKLPIRVSIQKNEQTGQDSNSVNIAPGAGAAGANGQAGGGFFQQQ